MSSDRRSYFLRRIAGLLMLFAIVATSRSALAGDLASAIHVAGAVAQVTDWSADRLEKEFAADMQTVQFTSHGQQHSAKCVALVTLLKRAGAPTDLKMNPKADPKTKNYPLRMMVVVTGRDGYTASFSLGELLPEVGHAVRGFHAALDRML